MLATYMYDATPEQVGSAYKCFEGSQPFYKVVNSKQEYDSEGHLIEYTVKAKYDKEAQKWVFSCTCLSGQHNFANVKHQSKVCWHVRAALACAQEEKKALREMAAQIDAEKQQAETTPAAPVETVTTSELVATAVVAEPVTDKVTPVTVTPTERAIVATEVARDLRSKTAARASAWNNSHQSTLTEREKWLYTAKPSHHMRKSEPVVKGALYSKPFNLYR